MQPYSQDRKTISLAGGMQSIISNMLNKPIREKPKYISYYESIPCTQIHMDTMFYELSGVKSKRLIPILVVCDVATRYIGAYIQTKKSDSISLHLASFIKEMRTMYPPPKRKGKGRLVTLRPVAVPKDGDILIVTDGAPEFKSIGKVYRHKVSLSINKAAIAEAAIKRIRWRFRRLETGSFLDALVDRKPEVIIDLPWLESNLPKVVKELNTTAKVRPPPPEVEPIPTKFNLGDLVFAKSKEKFEGEKLNLKLSKKSYLLNYDPEPLMINKIVTFNGRAKYEVMSTYNMESLKYYYYEEELQLIPDHLATDYINNYNSYWKTKENVKSKPIKLDWKFIK